VTQELRDLGTPEREVPVRSGRQTLHFVTAVRPSFAGIDPYNFYIDREPGDNVVGVRPKP